MPQADLQAAPGGQETSGFEPVLVAVGGVKQAATPTGWPITPSSIGRRQV